MSSIGPAAGQTDPKSVPSDSIQCGELDRARRVHGIPAGGSWWYTQAPMLKHLQSADAPSGIAVAWDKQGAEAKKMYGFYDSADDLYANLEQLPAGKWYSYEVIRERTPCRNYADIEWVGVRDRKHSKVHALLQEIRGLCKTKYGRDPEIYVGCSTRCVDEQAGLWKNSYHIICPNLVFESNHGGAMNAFWEELRGKLSGD